MNVYAESSAVLAWLLAEETGHSVREVLQHTELVMASDLTLVECDRVLIRAVTSGEIDEAAAADRQAHLSTAASHWHCGASVRTLLNARFIPSLPNPFAHLMRFTRASALAVRSAVPGVELLSLDTAFVEPRNSLGSMCNSDGVERRSRDRI